MKIGSLIDAVQRNCHIADARHARDMTMCNYLLEMREFYRWEHALRPDQPPPRDEVGHWLREREALWDAVADEDFAALPVANASIDPFAVDAVNAAVAQLGLGYGAGIGRFGRPHFFLGRLERSEEVDGLRIVVSNCEYARDLAAIPAALQGDTVVVRREALRQWLWEKAEAWGVKQVAGPMRQALSLWGWFDDAGAALDRMADAEIATLILHERGEHQAGAILGPAWEAMLTGLSSRRAELLARAVRDHWADCLVTLPVLVERAAWASLHFWFANLEGMRRQIFPRMAEAGAAWAADGDPAPVIAAARAGLAHWQAVAQRLLDGQRSAAAAAEAEMVRMTHNIETLAL
jgi:hypothetical protein